MVNDPADAADTTQEVFLKVFRGIKRFNGQSSLKTWIYRIAVHEASNRRRWWFRHKSREVALDPVANENSEQVRYGPRDTLEDSSPSPFEELATLEMRERVELELSRISEPFRTTLILRDIEELSYEEIADVMQVSLGTVKSRLTRGRQALKQRLEQHLEEFGIERESSAEENAIRPRQQAVEVHS
jgi:RNA polymerase sigma-70 factor (ECF subfamily)